MENEPENKPSRKRRIGIAFLLAGIGLLLVDRAVSPPALNEGGVLGWLGLVAGLLIIAIAVWCGTERI